MITRKNNLMSMVLLMCIMMTACSSEVEEAEFTKSLAPSQQLALEAKFSMVPPAPPAIFNYITLPASRHSFYSTATGIYAISISWNNAIMPDNSVHIEITDIDNGVIIESINTANDGSHTFADKVYPDGYYDIEIHQISSPNKFDYRTFTTTQEI